MKNLVLSALVVAAVLLGAFAWVQHQQIAALELAAIHATAAQNTLKGRLADDDRRIAAAEKARADAESELKELRNRPAPVPAPAPAANVEAARARAMSALDNPAIQQVMAATFKGALDQRYGGLFRQLKLSPAELEKFKELLTERQMSGLDVMRAAQSQGLNLAKDPAGLSELLAKAQGDVDGSVRTLLGDERFAQYQDYNQNIASYAMLEQIERRLSYTNVPLGAAQSDALLRALVQTTPAPTEGAQAAAASFAQSMAGLSPITAGLQRPLSNESVTAAQAILSKPQFEVLRQIQAEQRSQAGMLRGIRAGGGTTPAPAATPPSK